MSSYYAAAANGSRHRSALQNFHNEIKFRLLKRVAKPGCGLLDLGVGRAGDLSKWKRAGVSFVYGVDRDAGCIAEARRRCAGVRGVRVRLLRADCSRRGGLREVDWSWFDVISCQFTLHYMLETERTLKGFLWNVAVHGAAGARFVGTCFDGASVRRLLRDRERGESVEWSDRDGPFCRITKAYDERERRALEDHVGDGIDVWMRTVGRTHREWLVDFDEVLLPWMRRIGYGLRETRLFADEPDPRGFVGDMSDAERRLSSLNRSFVFRREREVWAKMVFSDLRP